MQPLTSHHVRLLGALGAYDRLLLSASIITKWDTRLKVLGWILGTEVLAVTLPSHKRGKLRELIAAWPPSRTSASAKKVSKLVGLLMHVSYAVRLGSFFVPRMLVSVGMPDIVAGADFECRIANHGRCVSLGVEFYGDLEVWPWLVAEGLDVRGVPCRL